MLKFIKSQNKEDIKCKGISTQRCINTNIICCIMEIISQQCHKNTLWHCCALCKNPLKGVVPAHCALRRCNLIVSGLALRDAPENCEQGLSLLLISPDDADAMREELAPPYSSSMILCLPPSSQSRFFQTVAKNLQSLEQNWNFSLFYCGFVLQTTCSSQAAQTTK